MKRQNAKKARFAAGLFYLELDAIKRALISIGVRGGGYAQSSLRQKLRHQGGGTKRQSRWEHKRGHSHPLDYNRDRSYGRRNKDRYTHSKQCNKILECKWYSHHHQLHRSHNHNKSIARILHSGWKSPEKESQLKFLTVSFSIVLFASCSKCWQEHQQIQGGHDPVTIAIRFRESTFKVINRLNTH